MGTMELLLFLLLVVGLPVAVLLAAGIWLVRQNRSDAHHLVGVVFIVLGLLSLLALVIGVVLVSSFSWWIQLNQMGGNLSLLLLFQGPLLPPPAGAEPERLWQRKYDLGKTARSKQGCEI